MKKTLLLIITILIIAIGTLTINYYKKLSIENDNNDIQQETITNDDIKVETGEYIDNNPIKLGLYKYYGKNKERELIKEYSTNWQYHKDISSFEVYYTTNDYITGENQINTFDIYKNNYNNIDNYRIGYIINFLTTSKEINQTILSPKDTNNFFEYLEIYLYDDYHRTGGWYSHTTEEEFNENTLLTSIKLTAGKFINEINSDITVTAFTYDNDDFSKEGQYKGISKYSIIIKNPNI